METGSPKPCIYIFYDYNENTGAGHKTRCEALAKEFRKKNFKVISSNVDDIFWYCNNQSESSIIIIDSYEQEDGIFNPNTYYNIFLIKDYKHPVQNFVNVINPNIYGNEIDYECKNTMGGKDYVMLREEFSKEYKKEINKNIKKVLITLGGSKQHHKLAKSIEKILRKKYIVKLVEYNDNLSVEEMIGYMLWADIVISGCGVTLSELACIGVPTIGIMLAENQRRIGLRYFYGENFLLDVIEKKHAKHNKWNLEKYSFKKRKEVSKIGKKIIDGKGASKVVDKILEIVEE